MTTDLLTHRVFPFHCTSLLDLPLNQITALCGRRLNFTQYWWESKRERKKRILLCCLNISLEAKGSLIVNSGSLSPLFPNLYLFIFFKNPSRKPLGPCPATLSPTHTCTYAIDLFIKVGAFKADRRRLFIISHSDPPQVFSEKRWRRATT